MKHSVGKKNRCVVQRVPFTQSGLSLIELLIATALGLLLTLGVIQIYLSGSNTYRQTQGLAHAQESARFVSAILTPDLRSAGTFGCLAAMGRPMDQVVDNRLNGGLLVPLDQAVQGWEYTGTSPGDSVTLDSGLATPDAANWASGTGGTSLPVALEGSVVTNSDVIIINAITPLDVPLKSGNPQNGNSINLAARSGLDAGRLIIATQGDCSRGELFQKSNNANASAIVMAGGNIEPGNNGNQFNLNYDSETRLYEFTSMAYYIGIGTNGEPALFRRLITPLQTPQELVSGVETLQFLYGVDTGGSRAADAYQSANLIDDWTQVTSIRLSAMTRSQNEVLLEENSRNFNMLGSEVSQGNNGDRRVRLISVNTSHLRGRM